MVVGTIGFLINTLGLIIGVRFGLSPSISGPLGAEAAIISNFTLNNFWTFSDKTITSWSVIPGKFIQFNILSFGSVIVQYIFLKVGEKIYGLEKYKQPLINSAWFPKIPSAPFILSVIKQNPLLSKFANKISAYFLFYILGVGVGLILNYIVYSQIIWR